MAYSPHQRKVQRRIVRIGRRRGEDRREIVANLMTGGQETQWRNLGYGMDDSEGYRQERRMYYRNPRNLGASINRWYDEANEFPGLRGAALAQAVQQSAYPDAYRQWRDEAYGILGRERGGGSSSSTTTRSTRIPGVDNSALRQQLQLQYLSTRNDPDALLNLAMGLQGAQDVAGGAVTRQRGVRGARTDGNGAVTGSGVPVMDMLRKAAKWDRAKTPYLWGGGHGSVAKPGQPVDCSGFVSAVLGLKTPMVSGQLAGWGKPGKGRNVTVWANSGHVLMSIKDPRTRKVRWFGTSSSNPNGGAGEISPPDAGYLSRFTARHPG